MDETKDTEKNPPEKKKSQDTSKGGSGTTPGKLSDEELDKLLVARGSKVGRENQKLRDAIASLSKDNTELTKSIAQIRREIRESKLDRSDPDAIRKFQDEEDLFSTQEEYKNLIAEARRKLEEVNERETELAEERISLIADSYGVDTEELKSYGVTDKEKLVKIAKAITTKKDESKGSEAEKAKKGESSGGGEEDMDSNLVSGTALKELKDLDADKQEQVSVADLNKALGKVGK